jgi:hypothetical protein
VVEIGPTADGRVDLADLAAKLTEALPEILTPLTSGYKLFTLCNP